MDMLNLKVLHQDFSAQPRFDSPGKVLTVTPHGGLTPGNFIRVSENVVEASLFCKSPSSDSNAQLGGNDSHRE